MRLSGTKTGAANQYRGLGDQLWDLGGARPTLDLNFAQSKSLVDATTGSNLVDHTRASSGTYVGSDGLIKTATTNLLLQSEDFSTTWVNTLLTDNTNAITAPDGTVTADEIIETTATNIRSKAQIITSVASTTYTLSVFANAGNGDQRYLRLSLNSAASTSLWAAASYDLSAGVVTSDNSAGGGTVTSTSIYPYPNGWFRCVLTGDIGANTDLNSIVTLTSSQSNYTPNGRGRTSYPGDGVSSIYIWGAQLEQSSTVGEYVKTTSTINSAPRFDHDPTTGESLGLLVEEARTNLHTQSEAFSDGYALGGLTQSTASITNPTGATQSQLFTEDTSTGTHRLFRAIAVTGAFVASIFVKSLKPGRKVYFQSDSTGGRDTAIFDIDNGVVESATVGLGFTGASIQAFPGGWYRLTVNSAGDPDANALYLWGLRTAASTSYTGDTTYGIYIWGAQLEAGSFPTSYIPTTDATVTRAADVASISGSNFSSWFNANDASVYVDSRVVNDPATTKVCWSMFGGSYDTNLRQPHLTGQAFRAVIGGTFSPSPGTGGKAVDGTTTKAFVVWSGTAGRLQVGGSSADVTAAGIPDGTQLSIGPHNGTIKRFTYWPQRLPNETLQTITQ